MIKCQWVTPPHLLIITKLILSAFTPAISQLTQLHYKAPPPSHISHPSSSLSGLLCFACVCLVYICEPKHVLLWLSQCFLSSWQNFFLHITCFIHIIIIRTITLWLETCMHVASVFCKELRVFAWHTFDSKKKKNAYLCPMMNNWFNVFFLFKSCSALKPQLPSRFIKPSKNDNRK